MSVATIDFEDIAAAATSDGVAVGTAYASTASNPAKRLGLVFSNGAFVFRNDGTSASYNLVLGPPSRAPNIGFLLNAMGGGFTITVEAGYSFNLLSLDYAVSTSSISINVYSRPDGGGAVNRVTHNISGRSTGWEAWVSGFVAVPPAFGDIAQVVFETSGLFLIDSLQFSSAAAPPPPPPPPPPPQIDYWPGRCFPWPAGTAR